MVDPIAKFTVINGHLAPFVLCWVNFWLTDVVIAGKHSVASIPLGIVYTYVNYTETIRRGKPLYWFATWEDIPATIGVFAFLGGASLVMFMLLALITRSLKRKPKKYQKKI